MRDNQVNYKWPKKFEEKGCFLENTVTMNEDELREMIIKCNPLNEEQIIYIIFLIRRYNQELKNDNVVTYVNNINAKELWEKCKTINGQKKFLSYFDLEVLTFQIMGDDFLNPIYFVGLIRSIYEGIYNNDLEILKNLNYSSIKTNRVEIIDNRGKLFSIPISEELYWILKDLSKIGVYRKNAKGIFRIKDDRIAPMKESCFKIEKYSNNGKAYSLSYYKKLNIIKQKYNLYSFLPKDIYTSGLIYRIKLEIEKEGFNLKTVFIDYYKIWKNKLKNLLIKYDYTDVFEGDIDKLRKNIKNRIDEF